MLSNNISYCITILYSLNKVSDIKCFSHVPSHFGDSLFFFRYYTYWSWNHSGGRKRSHDLGFLWWLLFMLAHKTGVHIVKRVTIHYFLLVLALWVRDVFSNWTHDVRQKSTWWHPNTQPCRSLIGVVCHDSCGTIALNNFRGSSGQKKYGRFMLTVVFLAAHMIR